jgi:hypothetical protein
LLIQKALKGFKIWFDSNTHFYLPRSFGSAIIGRSRRR